MKARRKEAVNDAYLIAVVDAPTEGSRSTPFVRRNAVQTAQLESTIEMYLNRSQHWQDDQEGVLR